MSSVAKAEQRLAANSPELNLSLFSRKKENFLELEYLRWMFANMTDLETADLHEMFKWQKGIKRVLETDSRFQCDDQKRWSIRRDDDVGYHSRNGSFMSTHDEQHYQPHSPVYKKVGCFFGYFY